MMLHLVCDISGSMSEGGKPFILRTLPRPWRNGCNRVWKAEIRLCAWSSEARSIPDWSVTDDLPVEMLVCHGSTNGQALVQLLGNEPDGKVLILTDGFWTRDDVKTPSRWQEGSRRIRCASSKSARMPTRIFPRGSKAQRCLPTEEVLCRTR